VIGADPTWRRTRPDRGQVPGIRETKRRRAVISGSSVLTCQSYCWR